jgi:hypothetical protein
VPLGITRVEETMAGTAGTREERRGDNSICRNSMQHFIFSIVCKSEK